jgi:phosphoribosylformylglycinamidine cyclo-ligase
MDTYAKAGVNIARSEAFVERLKKTASRPGHATLWKGAGGYAAVVPVTDQLGIALTTDGVGTKLLIACELGKLETIGIDLVAMCANDLVCVGAKPSAFLDYYATSKLNDEHADALIRGILEGCDQADMMLVGGETAEMPDLYSNNHFDIAGFAMGTVAKNELLTGAEINAGQAVIGIASSGIHSNGLSLARKVLPLDVFALELLKPTHIYVKPAVKILTELKAHVKGIANITGGGWRNILRLSAKVGIEINDPLPVPEVFLALAKHVEMAELYKTFNMGMGMVVIADGGVDEIVQTFASYGFTARQVGVTNNREEKISIHSNLSSKRERVEISN